MMVKFKRSCIISSMAIGLVLSVVDVQAFDFYQTSKTKGSFNDGNHTRNWTGTDQPFYFKSYLELRSSGSQVYNFRPISKAQVMQNEKDTAVSLGINNFRFRDIDIKKESIDAKSISLVRNFSTSRQYNFRPINNTKANNHRLANFDADQSNKWLIPTRSGVYQFRSHDYLRKNIARSSFSNNLLHATSSLLVWNKSIRIIPGSWQMDGS